MADAEATPQGIGAARPPRVGVLMMQTAFPRPPGDVGNPATFGGHGLYETVPGATIARVIGGPPEDPALAEAFVPARDRLVARGAEIVTTTCGMLVLHQDRLQRGCPVPVVTSSLLQLPLRLSTLRPGRTVGILALDSRRLRQAHLRAAGVTRDLPAGGLEGGHTLLRTIEADDPDAALDPSAAERDAVEAARALVARHPEIETIVLECANLPPYRAAIERSLGLPVYDLLTWIDEVLARGASAVSGRAAETRP